MLVADFVTGLLLLGAMLGIYFAPTIVAFAREVPSPWSIAITTCSSDGR